MFTVTAAIRCDGTDCLVHEKIEHRLGTDPKPPPGWFTLKWLPGIINNTSPRPDRHYCSQRCRDKKNEEDKTSPKSAPKGAPMEK
jgi:hypothetical protein